MSLGKVFLAVGLLTETACARGNIPAVYHGRLGGRILAIPSAIATSVLYEGESDWTPPDRPRSERTDRDTIETIEYFVDLDHPSAPIAEAQARVRLSAWGDKLHVPAVHGRVLGVTVGLPPGPWRGGIEQFRANYRISFREMRYLKPGAPLHGLSARYADYGKNAAGRDRHGLFTQDAEFHSSADQTDIVCNDAWMSVPPHSPMATCHIFVIDRDTGSVLSTDFDRIDLARWRDLRTAMLVTLDGFKVSATASR